MPTPLSHSFDTVNNGDLWFSGPSVTETDFGAVASFIGDYASPPAGTNPAFGAYSLFSLKGIQWGGFHAGASDGGAAKTGGSFSLTFNYDLVSTGANDAITGLSELVLTDVTSGAFAISATETAYDTVGNQVAQITWTPGHSAGANLAYGYKDLHIVLTVNGSVPVGQAGAVNFSAIRQTFTETTIANPAVIGNNVFLDLPGTGVQSGPEAGPPVAGVTVELLNGGGTTVLATTTTDANGLYHFNVAAGTYEVQFLAPSGYAFSPNTATAGDLGSAANPTTGITQTITVAAGQTIPSIDEGLVPLVSVALDKQVSTDGITWQDIGNGNLADDPTLLAGGTVYERVVVTNTGSWTLNGVNVTDIGSGPAGFTFSGGTSVTLNAGQAIVSDTATLTAQAGQWSDTATVTGTATVASTDVGVSAHDSANYNALTPAIAIDKQVSIDNGVTWADVGNGTLDDPSTLTGATVLERVIVSNTGSIALADTAVTDVGTGPSGFTFGGATSVSLAVGESLTSDVATLTAQGGYQTDTATVTGTATIGGQSANVTASDQGDFNALTPAIAIDKQVSIDNGVTWADVGNGTLDDPSTLTGATVLERVIVTNTGSIALTNASVTDVGSGPACFTFGNAGSVSLGIGESLTSDVATLTAQSGYQTDIATVTGTATVGGQSATVTASDQGDFNALPPAIAIDKQVSVDNGVTWADVGNGTLDDPSTLTGATVLERVIVTNTGSVALTNASVTDVGSGPSGFTFGNAASVSLGIGESLTSDVATLTAQSGYQTDTATVTGTATIGGQSATVSASDQGDYSAETPLGAVTGTVFDDFNADGLLNFCDDPVAGLTVRLLDAATGAIVTTTTTDASGAYSFAGVAAGTYEVGFVAPTGFHISPQAAGSGSTPNPGTGITSAITVAAGASVANVNAGLYQLAPLTTQQTTALTTGAHYGPPSNATFPDGPYTLTSGTGAALATGPAAGNANELVLVLSASAASIAQLGTQGITLAFNGQVVTFSAANFALGGSSGDGFSTGNIAGLGKGQVNGISFPTAEHAAVEIDFGKLLSAAGKTGSALGSVTVSSPIDLRVDIFGAKDGTIVGNAANSGAEGITGVAGTGLPCVSYGTLDAGTNLLATYGAATGVEFAFTPANGTTIHATEGGHVTGKAAPSMAFITVTDSASDKIGSTTHAYYEGSVSAGQMFYADSEAHYTGAASGTGSMAGTIFAHVFASASDFSAGKAAVQEIALGTDGLRGGDIFGAMQVTGYAGVIGSMLQS